MKIVTQCACFFALLGLCLGAPIERAQLANPTYAIVTLEHYQAYFGFAMLGPHLDTLARLGALAAALVCTSFVMWSAGVTGLKRYLAYSQRGERFSPPWKVLGICSTFSLGLIWQFGWSAALWAEMLTHAFGWGHHLLMLALPAVPMFCWARLDVRVPEHRLLRWPLGCLALLGLGLAMQGVQLANQVGLRNFPVPPMVSTHYGPWGMMGWTLGICTCLGLACGVLLLGLAPHPEAEPDSLQPLVKKNFLRAAVLGLVLSVTLLACYPFYLMPRYQVGMSLEDVRQELRQGELPGRTVVWLDRHDPAHTLQPRQSWATPDNLSSLQDWITTAPTPSALTRPAAKLLGDHALWQWRPQAALDWLEVHRRRQKFSNLNRAFLAVVAESKPDPRTVHHLDALLNRERFAWPGPGSRLELAAQLRRYGRNEEAQLWEDEAGELGADLLPAPPLPQVPGDLSGRLTLQGEPLAGVRIAIFRGQDKSELLARTREHILGEAALVENGLKPQYYQYIDFQRLRNFYSVQTTDSEGRFLFEDAEPGLYRLAVRLSQSHSYGGSSELVQLKEGQSLELPEIKLVAE